MASPTYARAHGPSEDQHKAVELVLAGFSDTDIAKRVGVARETVTRWRLYDDAFRAALDQRRREIWGRATDAVRALFPQAIETMCDQLRASRDRGRLALDFITRAGLMGKPYSGLLGQFDDPSADDASAGSSDFDGPESHSVTQDHAQSTNGATKVT